MHVRTRRSARICVLLMVAAAGCGGSGGERSSAGQPKGSPPTSTPAATATTNSASLVAQSTLLPWQLPAPVYRTMGSVLDGKLYVLGGLDAAGTTVAQVDMVDPAAETATGAGVLSQPTHGATALAVGGHILVFGGAAASVYSQVQGFDPATDTTQFVGQLPGPRADVAGAIVGNDVLLLGGFDGSGPLQSVLASSDGTSFHPAGQLALAVRYPAVAVYGGAIDLFGGLLSGAEYTGSFTTAIQRFDPASGTSEIVANLPAPLAHAMATELDGQILIIGGSTSSAPSAAIYRFDPATDALSVVGSLPEPVTDGVAVTLGQSAYVLGGISSGPLASVIAVTLAPRSR